MSSFYRSALKTRHAHFHLRHALISSPCCLHLLPLSVKKSRFFFFMVVCTFSVLFCSDLSHFTLRSGFDPSSCKTQKRLTHMPYCQLWQRFRLQSHICILTQYRYSSLWQLRSYDVLDFSNGRRKCSQY